MEGTPYSLYWEEPGHPLQTPFLVFLYMYLLSVTFSEAFFFFFFCN